MNQPGIAGRKEKMKKAAMLRKLRKILFLTLISGSVMCQDPGYLIKNYDASDLIQELSSVNSMVEDTLGMLFFAAAESLILFDGTEWISSRFNSGVIYNLFRDSRGHLWYGATHDFGRIRRSEQKGFELESLAHLVPDSLKYFGNIVNIVEYDSSHFFHSSSHIFRVKDDTVNAIEYNSTYPKGFVVNEDYIVNHNISGLLLYQSGQFTTIRGGDFYNGKTIVGMIDLSPDSIIIGTRTDGLFLFRPSTGKSDAWLPTESEIAESLRMTRLLHFISLPAGKLSFSTSDMGTFITDHHGNILRKLNKSSGTLDNSHKYAYITRLNIFWMCTGRGISIHNLDSPFYLWGPEEGIQGIMYTISDYKGSILAGTYGGLYVLGDPLNPEEEIDKVLNIPCWSIHKAEIYNNEEVRFLCTQDGLYLYRGNKPELLFPGNVYKTVQLNANKDFFITVGLSGLHAFSMSDGNIQNYQVLEHYFTDVKSVVQDKSDIWITYSSAGKMFRISQQEIIDRLLNEDLESLTYQEISTDSPITGFNIDENSVVFSSRDGFMVFDTLINSLRHLESWGEDVAAYNAEVSSMSMDPKGNIWLGGGNILLDRYDGTYSVYQMNVEGVSGNSLSSIVHHDEFGRTWIGDNRGLMLLDGLGYSDFIYSRVIITQVFQKDSLVSYIFRNNSGKSDQPVFSLKERKDISVYYSLPYYGDNSRIQYSFRMNRYFDRWSSWNNEKHIFFPNLKPGDYTFRVKARLEDGLETEASQISFTIERLWYETILFRITIAIILLLTIYKLILLILRGRIRREVKAEALLHKKVSEQFMVKLAESSGFNSEITADNIAGAGGHVPDAPLSKQEVFVEQLISLIEEHISESDLSVEKLSGMMQMSQKMLYRRVKSATGLSIISLIKKVRLKNAAKLLSSTDLSVAEAAYRVGFNDPSYFTKSFGSEFGKTPVRFQKEMEKINKRNPET